MSRDAHGMLWVETERDNTAYQIDLSTPDPQITAFPIDGVPDGLDIEAIDALADGTFLLGTEGHADADAAVWSASLGDDGHLHATLARRLDGRAQIGDNDGIEGLCGDRRHLVVGIEQPITEGGQRMAQLAVLDLDGDPASDQYLHVALTSDRGKIAALDCAGPGDVLAIERHFGISRLVHVSLPGDHAFTVTRDITEIAGGKNFEGVARLPDGRIALVNDNQYQGLDGPSYLLILP